MQEVNELLTGTKFMRLDGALRIALGVEVEKPPGVAPFDGIAEFRPYPKRGTVKAYLDLDPAAADDDGTFLTMSARVPEQLKGMGIKWAEILLSNNKSDEIVMFGRKGEEKPFTFKEKRQYIFLRVYPSAEIPFKDLCVCVDNLNEKRYFIIRIDWQNDNMTLTLERNPHREDIPSILD